MENDIDSLRWVRIFTPVHIPKYLIEQIKHRDWTVDDYIKFHEINCLKSTGSTPELNPFSHLYVLVDSENITKGFLWFTVEPLTRDLVIQNYSIDREYWSKGKAVGKLAAHVKFIRRKADLKKIYWVTQYPKHSEKHGFKQSKSILMEYSEVEDGEDPNGRREPQGKRRNADSAAATVSELDSGSDSAGSSAIVRPVHESV
jgi:hypothetical protein